MKADYIKELRTQLGLTQEEMAKRLGVGNYHTVMRWEKGHTKPSPLSVRALEALEMTSSGNIAVLNKITIGQRIRRLFRRL